MSDDNLSPSAAWAAYESARADAAAALLDAAEAWYAADTLEASDAATTVLIAATRAYGKAAAAYDAALDSRRAR